MKKIVPLVLKILTICIIVLIVFIRLFSLQVFDLFNLTTLMAKGYHYHTGKKINYYKKDLETTLDNTKKTACLILIHGLGDSPFTWIPQLNTLNKSTYNHLLIIELPYKNMTAEDLSITSLASFIQSEFSEQCDFETSTLIGASFGGAIAMRIAEQVKIRNIILESPAIVPIDIKEYKERFVPMNLTKLKTHINNSFYRPINFPDFLLTELISRYNSLPLEKFILAQEQELKRTPPLSFHPSTTDVTVIWGKADKVIPVVHVESIKLLYPEWNYKILEECAHKCHQEKSSLFNQLIFKNLI